MLTSKNEGNRIPFYIPIWNFIKKIKWNLLTLILICYLINYLGKIFLIQQIANWSIILTAILITARIRYINLLIAILFSIVIGLETSYFVLFGERVSTTILSASVDTFINYTIKVSFIILLKSLPIIIIISILLINSCLEIKKLKIKNYLILTSIIFFVAIFCIFNKLANFKENLVEEMLYNYAEDPLGNIKYLYYKEYPIIFGDVFYLAADIYTIRNIKNNSYHDKWPDGIVLPKQPDQPTKIIIVVGESSVSTHYSLYGYQYKTTPRLDGLNKNKEIIVIENAISPAPVTRESLRLTLSYATPHNAKNFFNYKNIVEMANMAGYQTLWISSTYENGPYAGYVGSIEKSSDLSYDISNHKLLKLQDDLSLPLVMDSLYKIGKKQFIILHMQGSHIPYQSHYDKEDIAVDTDKEFAEYNRTIHHTDRVLAKIIKLVKKYNENTIVFYFSDHGEIVNRGHGIVIDNHAKQYQIPIIFYQQKNIVDIPAIIEKYRTDNGKYNNLNGHYVITELLGYKIQTKIIKQAKKEGLFIYHSDGSIHKYEDLDKTKL